jgi:glycosyltransferase involved in cell wall biosynthesis
MTQRKKRILFLSDHAGAFTGFGKNTKLLLKYLYQTGKYEIYNAAQGMPKNGPHTQRFPWKTIGVLPDDPNKIAQINQDPNLGRLAAYGDMEIENIVKEFKPDVVFSVNDTWGSQFVTDKNFFDSIPTVCWNTFDSLPLLPDTIEKAKKIKHYWTWSDFARKELHKHGHEHVKNQYPLVNTDSFYKLPQEKIIEILQRYNLPQDSFIIGFVFRNQLRKLVNTQIEAYAQFKRQNPNIKNTFLYTHTHYGEGWDILRLCEQYGVNKEEVLCTYICKETKEYFIAPFNGQDIENPITKNKTLITTNVGLGVTDTQLNEIYNIFSLYSHPATSGACELPCVEAALTEKIIATCPYSFGEDIIELNSGSLEFKFSFYTEHGTQFLKSQPSASSMCNVFKKVYEMPVDKRTNLEKLSRQWALDNYSIKNNGKKIEEFIDSLEVLGDEIFEFKSSTNNPNPIAQITTNPDSKLWVKSLYKLILDREVTDEDEGVQHWLKQISEGRSLVDIENYFRHVAKEELSKRNNTTSLDQIFDKDDALKRVLIIQPESLGDIFLITSLFESIRNRYPKETHKIYFATKPQFQEIVDGNPYIDKWIPYDQSMDNIIAMEGAGPVNGICDIAYYPYFGTQRLLDYMHNGIDKLDLTLNN